MLHVHHWCAAGTVADLEDASRLYRPLAIARLRTVGGGRAVDWNRDWPGRTLVSRGMARAGDQMVLGSPVLGTGLACAARALSRRYRYRPRCGVRRISLGAHGRRPTTRGIRQELCAGSHLDRA